MNKEQFEIKFNDFITQFDAAFDAPENVSQIQQAAVANSSSEDEVERNYIFLYNQQRTNQLIKSALMNFLDFEE